MSAAYGFHKDHWPGPLAAGVYSIQPGNALRRFQLHRCSEDILMTRTATWIFLGIVFGLEAFAQVIPDHADEAPSSIKLSLPGLSLPLTGPAAGSLPGASRGD